MQANELFEQAEASVLKRANELPHVPEKVDPTDSDK